MNDEYLIEINKTLIPSLGLKTGKTGIFCPGQMGDTAQVMGILKYWDELFPGKEAVWFINTPNADLLRYSNVSEVRRWPWSGNHLPIGEPDHFPYLCNPDNTLNLELAKTRQDTSDLSDGFFPATHQVPSEKREGIEYSNVSKKIFGVPADLEWHPMLFWSAEEREMIKNFMESLPEGRKNILFETFGGSGQTSLDNDMVLQTIKMLKEKINCNIVFVSHKYLKQQEEYPEGFFNMDGIYSASQFTPRQCALLNNYCALMVYGLIYLR